MTEAVQRIVRRRQLKEGSSPDILPPSGGGNDGTTYLSNTYKRDTPGQSVKKKIKRFKDY
jgi:hypothetical protein